MCYNQSLPHLNYATALPMERAVPTMPLLTSPASMLMLVTAAYLLYNCGDCLGLSDAVKLNWWRRTSQRLNYKQMNVSWRRSWYKLNQSTQLYTHSDMSTPSKYRYVVHTFRIAIITAVIVLSTKISELRSLLSSLCDKLT